MPKEEAKEILPQTVEDDDDMIINQKKTPNIDNDATGHTFFGTKSPNRGKGIFDP